MSAPGPQPPTLKVAAPHASADGAATVVGCDSCGAVLEVAAGERGVRCPYCATATVVERAPSPDRPRPSFAIGFAIGRDDAERRARAHLRRQWLAPEAARRVGEATLRPVYLPAYLWSAAGRSAWAASIGEDYQVEYEVETTDAHGDKVKEKRTRTETEWHALSGQHAYWVRDVFVTASRGVANAELEAIQPFELVRMRRYQAQLIAGWPAEEPSLARAECEQLAWRAAEVHARQRIGGQLPGDRWRDLRVATRLDEVTLDLVLLPVWVLSHRWHPDRPPVRVLVNGQTGAAGGRAPVSPWKVAIQVALLIALVALIAWTWRP